jgi:ATP-dependent DNA helicase RecG
MGGKNKGISDYITDAIYRRENLDRYDDRLMVSCNLIDAYDQLIEFIAKHTLDRFHIVNNQSVSLRSKIARELVSNILVHREYTSAFPAKIIIERDRIITENWSLPKTPGRINPNNFAPYPKNPLLSHFFVNIGRADVLGSGVRNLYQFTKLYSGGEPELVDGDIFKTIVPLNLSFKEVNDNQNLNDKVNDNNEDRKHILAYIVQNGSISTTQAAQTIGRSHSTARRVLLQLVKENLLVSSGANKNKTYRLKTTSDKM